MAKKIIIMGAAGRDFHDFNVYFRNDPGYKVVAFTAAQIPFIQERTYPPELSGPLYPHGIPVYPEDRLTELIKKEGIDEVVFAYSDVSHEYVMHRASLVAALGASFTLLGADKTMLSSSKPVISVCAVRTGCGKSGVTRFAARIIQKLGKRVVAIRHPMPYGDLLKERSQMFTSLEDLEAAGCTIEEMEEYEPLVRAGVTVFAGVDYAEILKRAEALSDVIIWDGGNNDLPFIRPSLEIVVVDPLRPGDELGYYPGEANLLRAHCVVINKANSAKKEDLYLVKKNVMSVNPSARIFTTNSAVSVDANISGKSAVVVEDGPTLTHGGMRYGAGSVAARLFNAIPADVRPYAAGTIKETLDRYPGLTKILPAIGYSGTQIKELEDTINSTPADIVLLGTPVDLSRVMRINKPVVRVSYEVRDTAAPGLAGFIADFAGRAL